MAGTMASNFFRHQMGFVSFLLVLPRLASAQDPNPSISEGTCFFTAGNETDPRYIPCGNSAFGNFSCCESQDMCLSNNACYNGEFGVTYLASCTDPTYSDDVCPDKGAWDDQQWVGLSYCNGTSNEWVTCHDSNSGSNTVTSAGPCWCPTTSAIVAFTAPSKLDNVVSLPTETGLSMICSLDFVGCPGTATTLSSNYSSMKPPSSSAAGASRSTSNLSSSSFPTSLATGSASVDPAPTSISGSQPIGLRTEAKAGIGVGAAAGGLITLGLLWLLASRIRRRKQNRLSTDAQIRPRSQALAIEKDPSDKLAQRSPAWFGNKSELPTDEHNSASVVSPVSTQDAWNRPTSVEVEGSVPTYQSMGSHRPQAIGGDMAYIPYRKAEAPPVGVQGVPEEEIADQAANRPESDVYEMPAQVPGYHGR